MAGKALAAFILLVTLLQVRAQFTCFLDEACGGSDPTEITVQSARECCLQGLPVVRSFVPTDGSTACKKCFVIGFSPSNLTIKEEIEPLQREVRVELLTSPDGLDESVKNGMLHVTVELHHTASHPNATLGSDFIINDGNVSRIIISELVREVLTRPEGIRVKAINDNHTGEVEHFVLEVTSARLVDEEGLEIEDIEVLTGDPVIVTILDDDVILVEFSLNEFSVKEEDLVKTLNFTIKEPIPADTHFIVRAMTYKDYDKEYPALKAKYPDIKPYALQDEYDQAESEDFDSVSIPFTIPRNSLTPDRIVAITIIDDDLLEPEEEGVRLLIEVDDSKGTRLSEVQFGTRQIAVLRIENSDILTFGFQNHTVRVNDTDRTIDIDLPIRIISGRTEIPINLTFIIGENTTAQLGVDYQDFTAARVDIEPPNNFRGSNNIVAMVIHGDDIFEPREFLEVSMEYDFHLPEPFKPNYTNATSPINSMVVAPLDGRMMTHYRSTIIVIDEEITELVVNLTVPKEIREGGQFYPQLSVSHKVNVTFRVVAPASYGTATKNQDYSFQAESVLFSPASKVNATTLPVLISTDHLVEPNETFNVTVRYSTSPSDVRDLLKFTNPRQTITIIDQNSAKIGFETTPYDEEVDEHDGFAYLNVTVMGDQLADNAEVVVRVYTTSGTALSSADFQPPVDESLTFTGARQKIVVQIPIIDDTEFEQSEMFQAHLQLLSSNVNATVDPTSATVTIIDDDPPTVKACVLSSNLVLHTLSNEVQPGKNINISMGCGRKLVTSCDPNVDLEIRVDFLKDNFASTYVAILYEDYTVTIDDNLKILPSASPSDRITYTVGTMSASVLIADISLLTTRNRTDLTISTDNDTLQLAGLCGDLSGNLFYPDCTDTVGMGQPFDELIQSYMLKPSDQILPERLECGITANDTVISDPLMTVPIHAPEFGENLNLCYEIHGAADTYFNLVSDECTSVNAHYAMASSDSNLNIIDSMSIVAVDNEGICHNITIDAGSCYPEVNGQNRKLGRRKRSAPNLILEENGVSVISYPSRVRISVPNCEDNALVMWVVCQNQSLYDYTRDTTVGPVEMIKFEITRGLNLHEYSHGLLGQFWNIPIEVVQYTGPTVYSVDSPDKLFTVQVEHPSSTPPRQFVGIMYDVTWEWKHKKCIYAGDQQGGPAGEVRNDGSVIQGSYEDYAIDTVFGTKFKFGVFDRTCVQV